MIVKELLNMAGYIYSFFIDSRPEYNCEMSWFLGYCFEYVKMAFDALPHKRLHTGTLA